MDVRPCAHLGAASHSQTDGPAERVGIDCGKGTGTSAAGAVYAKIAHISLFLCCRRVLPARDSFRAHTVGVPTPRTLWAAESFALREVLAGIA